MADTASLAEATPNIAADKHPTRPGVSLPMGQRAGTVISPVWTMAGWALQFVRLAGGETLAVDHGQGDVFVKVVRGALSSPQRRAYPDVGAVVSTALGTSPGGARVGPGGGPGGVGPR